MEIRTRSTRRYGVLSARRGNRQRETLKRQSIRRVSRQRAESVKHRGTKVRSTRQRETQSVKRRGTKRGTSPLSTRSSIGRGTIGPLRKGKLTQFGYSTTSPARERHIALDKAVKNTMSALSIYRGLNAVYVYNKNTQPEKSKIFKADRDYIRKRYF